MIHVNFVSEARAASSVVHRARDLTAFATVGVGKTQIQTIINKKQEILEAYENNQRKGLKRQGSGKYAEVNEEVWKWYCLCRSSNIPVSGTMIQEEALIIAE